MKLKIGLTVLPVLLVLILLWTWWLTRVSTFVDIIGIQRCMLVTILARSFCGYVGAYTLYFEVELSDEHAPDENPPCSTEELHRILQLGLSMLPLANVVESSAEGSEVLE